MRADSLVETWGGGEELVCEEWQWQRAGGPRLSRSKGLEVGERLGGGPQQRLVHKQSF